MRECVISDAQVQKFSIISVHKVDVRGPDNIEERFRDCMDLLSRCMQIQILHNAVTIPSCDSSLKCTAATITYVVFSRVGGGGPDALRPFHYFLYGLFHSHTFWTAIDHWVSQFTCSHFPVIFINTLSFSYLGLNYWAVSFDVTLRE